MVIWSLNPEFALCGSRNEYTMKKFSIKKISFFLLTTSHMGIETSDFDFALYTYNLLIMRQLLP